MDELTGMWEGGFGIEYTDRNPSDHRALNVDCYNSLGISKGAINSLLYAGIPRSASILEVGANRGLQLSLLRDSNGFGDLTGLEVNKYAIDKSEEHIIRGSAVNIPRGDGAYDVIFTSGLLAHIHPMLVMQVMNEIHRCSRKYIAGFEYYNESYIEAPYQNTEHIMWKGDFCQIYLDTFPDLVLVRKFLLKHKDHDLYDCAFLLEKRE